MSGADVAACAADAREEDSHCGVWQSLCHEDDPCEQARIYAWCMQGMMSEPESALQVSTSAESCSS